MSWTPFVTRTSSDDYPVAYGCEFAEESPLENVHSVTLIFRYEFSVMNNNKEDARMFGIEMRNEVIPKLELLFLYKLMERAGLRACDIENQNIAAYAPPGEILEPPPRVISLTSFAVDGIIVDESTCERTMTAPLID